MPVCNIFTLVFTTMIIISSAFFSGCMTTTSPYNPSQEKTLHATPLPESSPVNFSIISSNPSSKFPNTTVTPLTPTPEPVFTEIARKMTDANGTVIISKVQAWNYAEKYLQTRGLKNLRSDEIKASDPDMVHVTRDEKELAWLFDISHVDSMGSERGGVIAVDAYDGHIIWFAEIS